MAFYRIVQPWNPGGRGDCQFTTRYETVVTLTAAEILSLVNAWATELNTHIPSLFCADIVFGSAECAEYEWNAPIGTPGPNNPGHFSDVTLPTVSTVAPVAGTVAGQSTPPQIALVVSFTGALAGRRNRGRVYTPNPPESVSDGSGGISDATARRTMIRECVEAVEAAIAPVDVDHVVHSVTYGSQVEVTGYSADAQADTQRRRAQ